MDELYFKSLADTVDGFYQGAQMVLRTIAQKIEADKKAQQKQTEIKPEDK